MSPFPPTTPWNGLPGVGVPTGTAEVSVEFDDVGSSIRPLGGASSGAAGSTKRCDPTSSQRAIGTAAKSPFPGGVHSSLAPVSVRIQFAVILASTRPHVPAP